MRSALRRRGVCGRRARLEGGSLPARARTRRGSFLSRIAVISDTHVPRGARALPDECLRLLAGADLVLHAGDFVSAQFLEELRRIGPPVEGVHGNMDEAALKAVLPKQRVVEDGNIRIGMVHDAGPRVGREARLAVRFEDCEAVIYGHTHVPQVEPQSRLANGTPELAGALDARPPGQGFSDHAGAGHAPGLTGKYRFKGESVLGESAPLRSRSTAPGLQGACP
ncbi:MAG: metallophosphoesterase family protein [Actinobacteria bacterium]|nr:MAG: metallophosphoesterase family protein [Actinomycetota bacterium]